MRENKRVCILVTVDHSKIQFKKLENLMLTKSPELNCYNLPIISLPHLNIFVQLLYFFEDVRTNLILSGSELYLPASLHLHK